MSPFPQHYLSFSLQIPPLVGQSRLGAIPTTGPHEVATRTEFVTYPSPIPSMATADDGTRELPVGIWEPGDTEPIGPLVVFSHGANGTMYNNESLFRELASHGYRVASVAHSKHTMFTRLSDGTIVTPPTSSSWTSSRHPEVRRHPDVRRPAEGLDRTSPR